MQDTKNETLQKLGNGIKALRQKRKWKLETLSYRIGISPSTVYRIEEGITEPKYLTLKKIAAAFELSLSEFFAHIEKTGI